MGGKEEIIKPIGKNELPEGKKKEGIRNFKSIILKMEKDEVVNMTYLTKEGEQKWRNEENDLPKMTEGNQPENIKHCRFVLTPMTTTKSRL